MWNSKAVLTSCLFACVACASGVVNAQLDTNGNLPPTADDIVRAFDGPRKATSDQPLPENSEVSEALNALPPSGGDDFGDSKPEYALLESDNTNAPHFALAIATSPATVFGQRESLTDQVSPALAKQSGCGESCRPRRRCVGDETCQTLTFDSGFAFISRSDPDPGILFANSVQPAQQLNAGGFDFGLQSGIEAGVIAHGLFTDFDLDLRFLGVGDISDSQNQSFTSSGMPISTPTQFDVIGPRRAESDLESSIRSFEANLRCRYGDGHRWWSLLAGFRYVALEERLATRLADPAGLLPDSLVASGTANHLYGAQIGIDAPLIGNANYNIDCYGRVGLFGNNSSTSTNFRSGIPGGAVFNAKREGGAASFVGELGLKATCRLSDAWNLYGRYQLLFVDDVALASQQFNSQHTTHGDVTFHGGTFGLEYVY